MPSLTCLLLSATLALSVGFAQPFVFSAANSASYDTSEIAQGSLFLLFGGDMGPDTLTYATSFPLPTTLAGTSVQVESGGTILQCPLVYSSSYQVAAILPSKTPLGRASFIVTYRGLTTGPPDTGYGPFANVTASAVGLYSLSSSGDGPGAINAPDGQIVSFSKPARPGDILTVWATGIGSRTGDDTLPQDARNIPGVEVFVGAASAQVVYAGPSPCCGGLDQISFEAPQTAGSCFMPVIVRSGGLVSNVVTLSINDGSGACLDDGPAVPSSIYTRALNGEKLKVATLVVGPLGILTQLGFDRNGYYAARLSAALHTKVSKRDAELLLRAIESHSRARVKHAMWKYRKSWNALDPHVKAWLLEPPNLSQVAASAGFGVVSNTSSAMSLFAGITAPAGTCTAIHYLPLLRPARSRALDAGPSLAVLGPGGQIAMPTVQGGQYQAVFESSQKGPSVVSGVYTIKGNGGRDVGPFSASINIDSNVIWTNKSDIGPSLMADQPLNVTWTGGTVPGHVLIGGYQSGSNVAGPPRAFFCTEDTAKGTFTVPPAFLSVLQKTSGQVNLFIGQHPMERQIAIPGLDLAWVIDGSSDSISLPVN